MWEVPEELNIGDGGREGGRALAREGKILFLLYRALQKHHHSAITSHPEPAIEPQEQWTLFLKQWSLNSKEVYSVADLRYRIPQFGLSSSGSPNPC